MWYPELLKIYNIPTNWTKLTDNTQNKINWAILGLMGPFCWPTFVSIAIKQKGHRPPLSPLNSARGPPSNFTCFICFTIIHIIGLFSCHQHVIHDIMEKLVLLELDLFYYIFVERVKWIISPWNKLNFTLSFFYYFYFSMSFLRVLFFII